MSAATTAWRKMLFDILDVGSEVKQVSAGADFKGSTNRELIGYQSRWPMAMPSVASPSRKLGYRFMAAEAAWILSGDNRLATIAPYTKHMARFSDDGLFLRGAYGPPFVEQVSWVAETLLTEPYSRQAVATIWRPRPGPGRDTPCTVALQWLVRNGGPGHEMTLNCVATMRSSDAWTGVPYDVFNFSMMTAYLGLVIKDTIAREARRRGAPTVGRPPKLGTLILTAGSQHLYKADWDEAQAVLTEAGSNAEEAVNLFEQSQLDLNMFSNPQELIDALWFIAHLPSSEAAGEALSRWHP